MNSQKSAYSNALANLSNSHYTISQASVEGDDREANLSAIGKTVTTDFGNIMLGHVATSSLAKLSSMGNQLGKLGINSSDAKILTKAIASGDRRKVGQMVARIGSKKVKLGIKKLTGKNLTDEELPDAVEQQVDKSAAEASKPIQLGDESRPPPAQAAQANEYELQSFKPTTGATDTEGGALPPRDPDFDNEEFTNFNDRFNNNFQGREPQGDDPDFFQQMAGRGASPPSAQEYTANIPEENVNPGQSSFKYTRPPAEEDDFQDALEAPEQAGLDASKSLQTSVKVANTTSKVVSTGEDVASGFEDATLLSTAADDTGVGLVATGVLGLASLFVGLFTKSAKPKIINPPPIMPSNYAIQAGLS